jgi:hypothetical protein
MTRLDLRVDRVVPDRLRADPGEQAALHAHGARRDHRHRGRHADGHGDLGIDAGVDRSLSGFGDDVLYVTKWPWKDVATGGTTATVAKSTIELRGQINEWIASTPGARSSSPSRDRGAAAHIVRGETA